MKTIAIKHVSIVALLAALYGNIATNFAHIDEQGTLNTILLFVGLIIVAPMFAYFQFSYEFTSKRGGVLFISHLTTAASLFVIGILLVMIDVLFQRLVGDIAIFRITLLVYYLACIGYDVWDYARFEEQGQ